MKFVDAVEKAIRSYYKGELPEEAIASSDKPFIFTMEYFAKEEAKDEAK